MKKILLFSLLIILIPTVIVNLFIRDDEIKFEYKENMTIRVKRTAGNIEIIPFEEYIVGVLAGEMPVSFHIEALKAQAVASRTYALKKMIDNINKEYDVVDTVANQVYLDETYLKEAWKEKYVDNINIIKTAVMSTYGQILQYNGEVIEAFFFSTSSGKTETSKDVFGTHLPYLISVDSSWDSISPAYTETKIFSLNEFCLKMSLNYSSILNFDITNQTKSGRINQIKINNKSFTGSDVASLLSLKSANFDIYQNDNTIIITTKGYGHGVGMSQYGAEAMGNLGYSYTEILKHYYTGVEIKKF